MSQAGAVIGCFLAADTTDKKALLLQGETGSLGARFSTVMLKIQQTLAKADEETWNGLMESDELKEFAFVLNEWREEVEVKAVRRRRKSDHITKCRRLSWLGTVI